jgi:hypothetical protein
METETKEFALDVADADGNEVELRFTGWLLAEARDKLLYLTDDDAIVFVDGDRYSTETRGDVDAEEIGAFFARDHDALVEACRALDIKPIVQL